MLTWNRMFPFTRLDGAYFGEQDREALCGFDGAGADRKREEGPWFLDSDYDGRCFCVCQAFFPDKTAWERLGKALGSTLDPEAFARLSGTISLPFPIGPHKRIAVKVIDPRGNEVMRVHKIGGSYV